MSRLAPTIRKNSFLFYLRRGLPWLGSVALVAWLISRHDLLEVRDALSQADLGGLAVLWLVSIAVTFVVDTLGLRMAFCLINGPIAWSKILKIKGVSYFLNIVNYAAASGGIAWSVSKRLRVPLAEAASTMLFLNVVDLLVLNALVSIGLGLEWFTEAQDTLLPAESIRPLLIANLCVYLLYFGSMTYWNLGWNYFVLGRLRPLAVFNAFRLATARIHIALFGARLVLLGVYIVMQYLALQMFVVDVPLGAVMIVNTVVTLVQTLPISIAGFGTVQVAMLELYAPYGSDSAILAYSTVSLLVFILVRASIGYVCLALDRKDAPSEGPGVTMGGSAEGR